MVIKNLGALALILVAAALLEGCASSPQSIGYRYRGVEYARPVVSPDGKYIAIDAYDHDEHQHRVELLTLHGMERRQLGKNTSFGEWSPDNQSAILVRSGGIDLITVVDSSVQPIKQWSQSELNGSPRLPR